MGDRGATRTEVQEAIRSGESLPAKKGRLAFRKNFPFNAAWKGKRYGTKQVMPIVVEEAGELVVVTVYVFYFGGSHEAQV
ncbi:MAG: hypothetical protein HY748_01170 [Elusimicrobia bacterium]|nr:hypothetical protein [Elusimicrobiota bacterium]